MKTANDRVQFIQAAVAGHDKYWDTLRPDMAKYRNAYATRFWKNSPALVDDAGIRVETADAYSAVESIMGSLFTKYPGVEIGTDIQGNGDSEITTELSNNFLKSCRQQVENAARMALIYPCSFLKLAPRESNKLLGKVALRAVPPWQVILDRDAAAQEDARFIGHRYYISVDEANEKFGNKKWQGVAQKDYFQPGKTDASQANYKDMVDLPNEYLYVQVVEMYDFLNDELLFWSPSWKSGNELLSRDAIPVKTFDGKPLSNLVPFFFSRMPDRPMEGYSALSRVYDQLFEKNVMRTFMANVVRRDSRQYLFKSGVLDADAIAKITAGIDGSMIPVEGDVPLDSLISIVPTGNINSDYEIYLQNIEMDLQRGAMTAGFTRGEASKATATEVTALMQYTASELGKMARDRDATIEAAALLYIRMLIPLVEDKEKQVINTPEGAKVVTVASLDADWNIYATDGGSTPMTDMMRKQQIIQLLPALLQLGVPTEALKAEIGRLYSLPESFMETVKEEPSTESVIPQIKEAAATTTDVIGGV